MPFPAEIGLGGLLCPAGLKIIFATVKVLFMPESTEGVAEGQKTASTEEEKAIH